MNFLSQNPIKNYPWTSMITINASVAIYQLPIRQFSLFGKRSIIDDTDGRKRACSGHANIDAFLVSAIATGIAISRVELAHLLLFTEVRIKLLQGSPEKLLQIHLNTK